MRPAPRYARPRPGNRLRRTPVPPAALGCAGSGVTGSVLLAVRRRWRYVQRGVAVEETGWLEREAAPRDRHHRPVLWPGEVRGPERVPDHDVVAVDVPVTGDEGGQPGSARMLVHEIAGRIALCRVVPGDPEMVGREPGPLVEGRGRVVQQGRRGFGVQRVAHRAAEPGRALGADHPPGPAAGSVRPPGGLRRPAAPGHLLN